MPPDGLFAGESRSGQLEGVGCPATLHPVQQQMVEHFGSQCGYCTPGFICSMFEGYCLDDLRMSDDLDDQLSGNLCRCTGYRPIRDAVAAFGSGNDEMLLASPATCEAIWMAIHARPC